MGETTIDGLKVRSVKKKSVSAKKPQNSAVNLGAPKKAPAKKVATSRNTVNTTRPKVERPAKDAVRSFTENSDEDWASVLSKMGADDTVQSRSDQVDVLEDGRAENTGSANDWLDDWGSDGGAMLSDEFDFDDEEPKEPSKKHKRHKKKRHLGRKVAFVIILLVIGVGVLLYNWGDSLISRLTGGNSGLWSTISAMIAEEIPFLEDENGRTNVLVFGTEGYDMSGNTGDGGTHDGSQLTDSIMVISFDQKTKDVALLSLPRDLKVPMACYAGKINEVFTCYNDNGSNEQAGAEAMMQQVGQILGIDIQYYAHVNWASLIQVVDILGGITVTLDEDINDVGWTNAVATAGVPITVNGEQALGLARARHGTTGGDFTRGNTQQKIVAAIAEKVMSSGMDMGKAIDILNVLGDNLRTNFSTDNVKAGLRLMSGFAVDNIRQVPLVDYENYIMYVTTATINEISYVVPATGDGNFQEIKEYVAQMFSSDSTAREGATVAVYNGTGVPGLAGAEREKLATDGYTVIGVGDVGEGVCEERFCVFAADETKPGTAAKLAERYGVNIRYEMPIEAGADFLIVIGKEE